jgi:tRNA-splicing ligase RtcB (3'-phosphate/5'-hydroxy nucleic acid ligase)
MSVRRGERSFDEVVEEIGEVEQRLEAALEQTALPDSPDEDAVNAFLVDAYRRAWAGDSRSPPGIHDTGRKEGKTMSTIKTFGTVDERSLEQLKRCMEAGDAKFGVLCADHHPGYSQPIGGGIAYEGYVSPSGVGYDIGCGNKAARTELTRDDLDALGGVGAVMGEITRRISFGMGVPAAERTDHPVLDRIRNADFAPQRKLAQLAESQLGTVGSGNHYVNLMEDENGRIWVGVHFGSRGFGHKTASGFLALAQGLAFDGRANESEMDSPPVLFEVGSELGDAYVAAMQLAGEYAYAGRDVVVAKVLEILSAEAVHEVHNHHNFAWREEHFGRSYWVIRKGCTPARPDQEGFVGGSMGDDSVILEGVESDENEQALYSTVHGAGRVMSRSQAAGRIRRRKRYACRHRDCDRVFDIDGISSSAGVPKKGVCPDHPESGVMKVWVQEQVKPGLVDWPAVQTRLREQGIVLVGGGADEAPDVYKRLPEVLAAHRDSVRVKHTLGEVAKPIPSVSGQRLVVRRADAQDAPHRALDDDRHADARAKAAGTNGPGDRLAEQQTSSSSRSRSRTPSRATASASLRRVATRVAEPRGADHRRRQGSGEWSRSEGDSGARPCPSLQEPTRAASCSGQSPPPTSRHGWRHSPISSLRRSRTPTRATACACSRTSKPPFGASPRSLREAYRATSF